MDVKHALLVNLDAIYDGSNMMTSFETTFQFVQIKIEFLEDFNKNVELKTWKFYEICD